MSARHHCLIVLTNVEKKTAVVSRRGLSSPINVKLTAALAKLSLISEDPVVCGGAGAKLLRLVEGVEGETLWSFPKAGTSLWDVCAAQAILDGVGGKLTDSFGNDIDYFEEGRNFENRDGVVAALDVAIHRQAIDLLKQIREREQSEEKVAGE